MPTQTTPIATAIIHSNRRMSGVTYFSSFQSKMSQIDVAGFESRFRNVEPTGIACASRGDAPKSGKSNAGGVSGGGGGGGGDGGKGSPVGSDQLAVSKRMVSPQLAHRPAVPRSLSGTRSDVRQNGQLIWNMGKNGAGAKNRRRNCHLSEKIITCPRGRNKKNVSRRGAGGEAAP